MTEVELPALNEDVLFNIGLYLDLESMYHFGLASQSTFSATEQIPKDYALYREVPSFTSEDTELPLQLTRLVKGCGAEINKNSKEFEKNVANVKIAALTTVLSRTIPSALNEVFSNHMIDLFNEAVGAYNIAAVLLLLDQKLPNKTELIITNDIVEDAFMEAVEHDFRKLIPIFVKRLGFQRMNLEILKRGLKLALVEKHVKLFAIILALFCKCEPNLNAVNEVISNALFSCAESGDERVCMELAKMFHLRVRFKKLRITEDRYKQIARMNAKTFSNVNEEQEEQRLGDEETEFSEGLRIFQEAIQAVLLTACRNDHTKLARLILESKLAGEVTDEIMTSFFKTAVGILDYETTYWLLTSKKIDLRTLCEYFIDCSRRNKFHSVELLLKTKMIPKPTITVAINETLRSGHKETLELLQSWSSAL